MALLYLLTALGAGEMVFGYYLSNHPEAFPFGAAEAAIIQVTPRWAGTYESPNHYGSFLVMAMGAALALGSFSRLAWPARIIFFYAAIMMIVGVIYSGSRGSWISLLAAIAALVIIGIRNGAMRWWWPVSGALVLVGATLFLFTVSPIAQQRLARTPNPIEGGELRNEPRVGLNRDALRIAQDHPIFGTGPGTFPFVHPHYQSDHFDFKAERTHDDYLNCLDDYGLAGLALALFFVAAVTLKFFQPLNVDNRWQDRVLVAAGFAAWAALLIHSFFDYNLHIPANALLLFSLVGLAVGRVKAEKPPHWSTLSLAPLGRWLGWGVMLMGLVYGAEVARTAVSDITYETALLRAGEIPIPNSIGAAEEAVRDDPGNGSAWAFLGDLRRLQASQEGDNDNRLSDGRKALEAYREALQANPLDDSLHARMGLTLDLMQNYPDALPHYLEAVNAQPHNGQFWFWLGNHFAASGDAKQAVESYTLMGRCFHPPEWWAQANKALQDLSTRERASSVAAPAGTPSASAVKPFPAP
jgi:O-antigen ligase